MNEKTLHQRVDNLVHNYILIRDAIHELEAKAKAFIAPYEAKKEELAALLLQALEANGAEMMRTKYGPVWVEVKYTAPLTDQDAFMAFVREHDQWVLLERRANATAVREYTEGNGGILPPGVKLNARRRVGVRSS